MNLPSGYAFENEAPGKTQASDFLTWRIVSKKNAGHLEMTTDVLRKSGLHKAEEYAQRFEESLSFAREIAWEFKIVAKPE